MAVCPYTCNLNWNRFLRALPHQKGAASQSQRVAVQFRATITLQMKTPALLEQPPGKKTTITFLKEKELGMPKIANRHSKYNGGLPLLDWTPKAPLYFRTYAGKRIERLFGLSPHFAEATARLADFGDGEWR